MADVPIQTDERRPQPFVEGTVKSGKVSTVERIATIDDARRIYDALKVYRDQRGVDYAKIRGQRDGNRPYSERKLRELGQGWRSNVNFGQHESILEQNIDKFWMLGNSVDTVITASCHVKDPQRPNDELGRTAEEIYTRIWRTWEDRIALEQLMLDQMLEFGHTAIRFSDAYNWQFDVVRSGMVVYGRNTEARPKKIKFAMELGTLEPSLLLRLFSDPNGKLQDADMEKISSDEGWNLDVVRATLEAHFKDPGLNRDEAGKSSFESIQQRFKNNDISMDEAYLKDLNCCWQWVQEYDGTASLYLFATDIRCDTDGFLFRKRSIAPSMASAFIPIVYSFGDGTMRSVRGIGHRIFPHAELSDRAMNMAFDAGTFNASMLVSSRGPSAESKAPIQRLGPVTVLDADYQPVQQQYKPNFEALVGLRDIVQKIMSNNAAFFRPAAEDNRPTATKSATQIREEAQQEAGISGAKMALYYGQMDLVHREIFRRLIQKDYPTHCAGYEEHKLFMDEWKRLGMPPDVLKPENFTIFATRVIGSGSTSEKLRINERITAMAPSLPGNGSWAAKRNEIVGLVGTENADRFIGRRPSELVTTSETSLATLENVAMETGRMIPVGSDQPVAIHFLVHIGPLIRLFQQFQQNPQSVNAASAVPYMASAIPHLEEHVNVLRPDRQMAALVKQYDAQLEQLVLFFKVLQKQYDQMQVAAQQQAQRQQILAQQESEQNRKARMELADLQHKLRVREMSAAANIQAKHAKTQAQIEDMHALTAAELQDKGNGDGDGIVPMP